MGRTSEEANEQLRDLELSSIIVPSAVEELDDETHSFLGRVAIDDLFLDRQRYLGLSRRPVPTRHIVSDSLATITTESRVLEGPGEVDLTERLAREQELEQRAGNGSTDQLYFPLINTISNDTFNDTRGGYTMRAPPSREPNQSPNLVYHTSCVLLDKLPVTGTVSGGEARRQATRARQATLKQ
jgi:hypothetical protein